nr:protein C [Redspotted grouper nervous necrosis virus]
MGPSSAWVWKATLQASSFPFRILRTFALHTNCPKLTTCQILFAGQGARARRQLLSTNVSKPSAPSSARSCINLAILLVITKQLVMPTTLIQLSRASVTPVSTLLDR